MRAKLITRKGKVSLPTFAASLVLAMAFTLSCSSDGDDDGGSGNSSGVVTGGSSSSNGNSGNSSSSVATGGSSSSKDNSCHDAPTNGDAVVYGEETYETVIICTQTWMKKNLNYEVAGSECKNCETYGRLYNWVAATTACPSGWHLPSDAEWDTLMEAVGGSRTAGTKLKAIENMGTDDYGFSALPGGFINSNGNSGGGGTGYWWSSTESYSGEAYFRYIGRLDEDVSRTTNLKGYYYSVRCVKN
jgi:uncharacterized protein (TIGR02145 family)